MDPIADTSHPSLLPRGSLRCTCGAGQHATALVAVTGGPGAGKTAVLELARRSFCEHLGFLPEAAGIVFGGGFPRNGQDPTRRAAQRAIYHVQRQLEMLAEAERDVAVVVCDRGTVDGVAYWPGDPDEYWNELGTDIETEVGRYAAVIHMETPAEAQGYNHDNPLRVESAREAREIDARILAAWGAHPNRMVVPSRADFAEKAVRALTGLRAQLPPCCREHGVHPMPGS